MIIEDFTFFLWEVHCDGCGEVKIFYKEDVPMEQDIHGELLSRKWMITPDGITYCPRCAESVDGG